MLKRFPSPGTPVSGATLLLLSFCLVAVGAGASMALIPGPRVDHAADGAGETVYRPASEEFADERPVELKVVEAEALSLLAPSPGIVTKFDCRPGGKIVSGTAPLTIEGERKIALSTSVPLWRDLTAGTKGEDVGALQRELRRLDFYHAEVTSRYDGATARAVRRVVESATGERPKLSSLLLSSVIWMPQPTTVVEKCQAFAGSRLGGREPIATTKAAVQAVTFKAMPTDLVPGKRQLVVGEKALQIGEAGEITDRKSLDALVSSKDYAVFKESGGQVPLRGTYRLAEPLQVYSLPPTALGFGGEDDACVRTADGGQLAVSVVSSTLGRSLVRTVDGSPLPAIETVASAEGGCA